MKKAFTMLELVFVMVVIGILAAIMLKNIQPSSVHEASTLLSSHIRYAQHLAMVDDKIDSANSGWFKNRWQVVFNSNSYSIVSNNATLYADNPSNDDTKLQDIDLADRYDVTISLGGSCNSQTILSFDNIGRPMVGDLSDDTSSYLAGQLISSTCTVTVSNGVENSVINIEPETGYIHILN